MVGVFFRALDNILKELRALTTWVFSIIDETQIFLQLKVKCLCVLGDLGKLCSKAGAFWTYLGGPIN